MSPDPWEREHDFPAMSHHTGAEVPRCPVCTATLNGATAVDQSDRDAPAPPQPHDGAISVCIYCTSFLQYQGSSALVPMPRDLPLESDQLAMMERVADQWAKRRLTYQHPETRPLAIPRGPSGWRAGVLFRNNYLVIGAQHFPKEKYALRAARGACGPAFCQVGVARGNDGFYWIGSRFRLFGEWHLLPPIGPYANKATAEAEQVMKARDAFRQMDSTLANTGVGLA